MKPKRKWVPLILAGTVLLSGNALSQLYSPQTAYAEVQQPAPDTPLDKNKLQQPMAVQSVEKLDNGVKLDLGAEEAYIRLLTSDMAKVSILNKGEEEFVSPGIAKTDWGTPKFRVKEDDKRIVITTDSLTVDINKSPFGIKYLDKSGNVINEDDIKGSGYEDEKPYVFKKTDKTENFYGFGEQTGGLNKRGYDIGMWNTDAYSYTKDTKYVYATIPFFIGLKGQKAYGLFFDNTYRAHFNMAKESDDYYYYYADGGKLTYYFINGPEIKDVVDRYTDLTGKINLPPEWSLGFQQSKWGYWQDDIVRVAKTFREKQIPADAMYADIDYMNDYRVFTWGPKYSDPDKLKADMDNLNFKYVTINDPGVKVDESFDTYQEGTKNNFWVKHADGSPYVGYVWPGDSVFPNFLRTDVRDWWAQKHKALFDKGVSGIWNDMNEPAVFGGPGWSMPLDTVYEADDGSKKQNKEIHNIFGHLENEATYKGFKVNKPNVRPFVLTRSAYAGTQRYAAIWTGDNTSNWDHLRMTIPMNSNLGLSGAAFVGNDIGGFAKPTSQDVPTPELFARWIEVGAFVPFSRDHYSWDKEQEPWAFGKEVEDISRKYISLRYELLPYLYNQFKRAQESGQPVQQPLVYHFQHDPNTYNNDDQYMFGDSLMIAPVVNQGATSRSVYLPAGTKWVDYWTGEEFEGGQTITKQADLGTLPIYVKQDSIIPRREVQQYTGEKKLTNLILDTYLAGQASYSFYEDDANTEDYTRGEFNVTDFRVEQKGNHIEFEQDKQTQNYDSDIQSYTLKLHDAKEPNKVQAAENKYGKASSLDELNQQESGYYFDAAAKVLYVKIPANESHKVKID
ncbi:alpha-glucosidase [Paenibacillus forsythiae]|uniref:Alpha-glucosidase n=1 Tax=Paenibacillus forsythiae TaxID=365616 RepID=A0ABU3HD12_9BACL|nr:glycoside hydrolase family 31 protein [Paenibacillus forsythiae]MDT3428694.1 alpha-glucosidase [Paenibacillus forsythiae]